MSKFIELHNFSGDGIFINVNKITHFSPLVSEGESIPCALISVEQNFQTGIIVKETPADILDKIRESEQNEETGSGAVFAKEIAEAIKREFNSI
ncbi:hypothetical protein EZS27_004527 [termite gut metagenome]|uniref:Uncharacterized protein n=1 Tax=termite gut metagenome TaxID=433724 RepID=A0A5J4SSF6_9ZZZZ